MNTEDALVYLELTRENCTVATVTKAKKTLSQRYHPDKPTGDSQLFDQVRQAADHLLSELEIYDGVLPDELLVRLTQSAVARLIQKLAEHPGAHKIDKTDYRKRETSPHVLTMETAIRAVQGDLRNAQAGMSKRLNDIFKSARSMRNAISAMKDPSPIVVQMEKAARAGAITELLQLRNNIRMCGREIDVLDGLALKGAPQVLTSPGGSASAFQRTGDFGGFFNYP